MSKLKDPQVVKIFFSSPFGGMEEEREELTRRYFPSIHHLCNSKGLQFAAVDMRWGITSESSDNAQVINICLREIDRSDMFVGFFGQRYGWHGADDKVLQDNFNNAVGRYPWLNNFKDKSVTELEFLHGFLNNPGHLPATIFFRDKSYDDIQREEGIKNGDKKQVFKYTAESELSTQLMTDLKRRVLENKDKSLGVFMDYKTPVEAAKIMYEIIMKHLKEVLLANLQVTIGTRQEELLGQHNAFLSSRCNIYVHGESNIQLLNKQLLAEEKQNVLVTGEAGCGKSALLCNWVTSLKAVDRSSYAIVYHFVGFAESSTDVLNILKRLVEEFELMSSSMIDGQSTQGAPDNQTSTTVDVRQLMQRLVAAMLTISSKGKTPVLIVDGLDKIVSSSKISKVLYWLPCNFPKNSLVVVSTSDTDQSTIDELNHRNYTTISIQALPDTYKRDMCVKTLQESGKELSPHQLDRIVAADMTKNPLFLKVTLSELVSFGYFRLLDKKIDSLVTSASIEDLLLKVLQRLEQDYNVEEHEGPLVEEVFSVIVLSRQGMSETDLQALFSIPDHVWSPLYFAIEKLVVNQSGKIKFAFRELEEATRKAYHGDKAKKDTYLKKMIHFFERKMNTPATSHFKLSHSAAELPWLWLQLGDTEGLADCLSNFQIFSDLEEYSVYDLVYLWRETRLPGSKIVEKLLSTFDKRVAEVYTDLEEKFQLKTSLSPGLKLHKFLQKVDRYLQEAGFHEHREKVILRRIKVLKEGLEHGCVDDVKTVKSELLSAKYRLACVYCQLTHTTQKGITLHKQLLEEILASKEVQTGPFSHKNIGNLYHGIGVGYIYLQEYEKGIEYSLKAIESFQTNAGDSLLKEVVVSWTNLGLAYMHTGQLDKALEYLDKCIEAYEEIYFSELPPEVGEVLTNKGLVLRRLNRLGDAEQAYKRSIQVKVNALGENHTATAVGYLNMSSLELFRDNVQSSMEYASKAISIHEAVGQMWEDPNYIKCLENKLACQTSLQQFDEADETFQAVLNWRVKEKDMDSCMASMYRDMTKHYLRAGMFEKAYHTIYALLDSVHKTALVQYILMDCALQGMPAEYRKNLPTEMSLVTAVEKHPEEVMLVKRLIELYLVPAGNSDEVVRLINRLHDYSDLGDQVYVLTCDWCRKNQQCLQRNVEEGLQRYPGQPELVLELCKCHVSQQEYKAALVLLAPLAENNPSNFSLVHFAAYTAAHADDAETSRKFCQIIIQNCPDEAIVKKAETILDIINQVNSQEEINSGSGSGEAANA